jgi:hypothetical protein
VTVSFFVIVLDYAITTEGSELIRRVFADHSRVLEDAFSSLDNSEKDVLRKLLRKVGDAAENDPARQQAPVKYGTAGLR